jgi:hypothetical protein
VASSQPAFIVGVPEPAGGGDHVPPGGGGRGRADMPAHLHGADRLEAAVVADRGGVHLTCQDVDPQQLGPVSVTPRPLGEQPAAS